MLELSGLVVSQGISHFSTKQRRVKRDRLTCLVSHSHLLFEVGPVPKLPHLRVFPSFILVERSLKNMQK